MLIKVFTQTLGWLTIHRTCGLAPGRNSFDAELGGCAMSMNHLSQWIDKGMRERQMLCCLSPAMCIFRWNASHAGGPLPSSPSPPLGLWVACGSDVRGLWFWVVKEVGQVFYLSNDIESTVASSLLAVANCAFTVAAQMEEVLCGSVWNLIGLLLTTDDVVKEYAQRLVVGMWETDMEHWETPSS